jgi:thiol-disulfide isomerase/thioredoxin
MDKILKISATLFVFIVIGCVAVFAGGFLNTSSQGTAGANSVSSGNVTVFFFYGEECPHCHKIMPFLNNLSIKYPDVDFRSLEIWHNQTNYVVFNRMNAALDITTAGVPEVIVGKTALDGEIEIPEKLEAVIQDELKKKH